MSSRVALCRRTRLHTELNPGRQKRAPGGSLTAARICYTEKPVMAISKELLEILVCPLCKAALELKEDQSGLKCVECKRVYPIRDDIPVMLIDEARIEE